MIEKDMTATDRQFMIECLCEDIVPMIIEEYHLTDKEAFDRLYKSKTFSKIEDPETGLYYQSPVYVFDMCSKRNSPELLFPEEEILCRTAVRQISPM